MIPIQYGIGYDRDGYIATMTKTNTFLQTGAGTNRSFEPWMHLVGPCHRMPSVCLFGGCRIVEDLLITWEGWWGLSNGYSYKTKNARLRIFSNLFSTNYRLSLTWDFCPHPPINPLHPNHIFIRDFPDYALLDHQAPTNSLILLLFLLTLDFFCLVRVRVDTWFSEVTD